MAKSDTHRILDAAMAADAASVAPNEADNLAAIRRTLEKEFGPDYDQDAATAYHAALSDTEQTPATAAVAYRAILADRKRRGPVGGDKTETALRMFEASRVGKRIHLVRVEVIQTNPSTHYEIRVDKTNAAGGRIAAGVQMFGCLIDGQTEFMAAVVGLNRDANGWEMDTGSNAPVSK